MKSLLKSILLWFTIRKILSLIILGALAVLVLSLMDYSFDFKAPWTYDRSPQAVKDRFDSPDMQDRVIRDGNGTIIGLKGKGEK
jgi:hypothetical protein